MSTIKYTPPVKGEKIVYKDGLLQVPDHPVIPVIEGDGIGSDITPAARAVMDAGVEKAYEGKRAIQWMEILAGEKANEKCGSYLPDETVDAIRDYVVSIKGPLTTPVSGGIRSLNVTLRQVLDLYSCVRPVRYIPGIEAPVKKPELMDVVIFRENTEDLYSGIEWKAGSPENEKMRAFLKDEFSVELRENTGIGVKPISEYATKRLVRAAIHYMIDRKRSSLTLVHKGNIMKFTEGAFRDWGYELAKEEFGDLFITEQDLWDKYDCKIPDGKYVIKDRIADNMLQQILTRTADFDVLALPNLNGDYISDACAAQVGGLGMAPGANIGDGTSLFEATHGTAPKYTGQDMANPSSLLLSGVMMLQYLGWNESADLIMQAIEKTIAQKEVTYDLARTLGVDPVGTSGYAKAIIKNL